MLKINIEKTINIAFLGLLLTLFFLGVFLMPEEAEANTNYVFDNRVNATYTVPPEPYYNQSMNTNSLYNNNAYQYPNYSYQPNTASVQTSTGAQINSTSSASTGTPTVYSGTPATSTSGGASTSTSASESSDLAASVIFGDGGFLPSGLLEWILFGVVTLTIVILARRVFGNKKNFLQAPLKHA